MNSTLFSRSLGQLLKGAPERHASTRTRKLFLADMGELRLQAGRQNIGPWSHGGPSREWPFWPPPMAGCLPGLNGLELQEHLARDHGDIPIVFITGHGDVPMSVQAMKAGAVDFLPKPFEDDALLDAIERAIERDKKHRLKQKHISRIRARLKSLTPREYEVLALVVTGLLNKQVAGRLGITEKTVKVHRARVMTKMRAGSLAELVRLAQQVEPGASA